MLFRVLAITSLVCCASRRVVGDNNCTVDQSCSTVFTYFSNIQFTGCPSAQSALTSRPVAALNCLNMYTECTAFVCDPSCSSCCPCMGTDMTGIKFDSGGSFLKRKLVKYNLPYNLASLVTDVTVDIPGGLVPGDLVYLRATLLKYDSFFLNFKVNISTTNYQFKAKCDDPCFSSYNCSTASQCSSKSLVTAYLYNNTWDSLSAHTYPFEPNQTFEMHFLVQQTSVTYYINFNKTQSSNFTTPLPPYKVTYFIITGTLMVHELSV